MMMLSMTIVTMDHFSLPVVAMDVRVVCIRAFQILGSGLIVLSFKYFVMWKWIIGKIISTLMNKHLACIPWTVIWILPRKT